MHRNTTSFLQRPGPPFSTVLVEKQVQQGPNLGLHIFADLKWSTHISKICKRAASTLRFLQRNIQKCHQECQCLAYIALIRSLLKYCATVWDQYLKQERVQRQAARFIKRDYRTRETGCMGCMLLELNLPPMREAAVADNLLQDCGGPHLSHASRKPPDASRQKLKKNLPNHLQGL